MIRSDLRKLEETREVSIELGLISEADGSAEVQAARPVESITKPGTKVVASVSGPTQPRFSRHELYDRASIDFQLDIAVPGVTATSWSTADLYTRKKCLIKFLRNVLTPCIRLEDFPRMLIVFNVFVSSSDGAEMGMTLNTCLLALLDASIPLHYIPCAASLCSSISPSVPVSIATTSTMAKNETEITQILLDPTREEEENSRSVYTIVYCFGSTGSIRNSSGEMDITTSNSDTCTGNTSLNQSAVIACECSGRFAQADLPTIFQLADKAAQAHYQSIRHVIEAKLDIR